MTSTAQASKAPKGPVFFSPSDLPVRVREIATLRGLGYSFREIGEQLDVTPQAVSLMLSRHRRSLKSLNSSIELRSLSARAANALGRHGILTRQEAREKDVLALLRHERNCGRKTLDELARWINDLDAPPEASNPPDDEQS